jgi:hypothetical protein
METIMTLLEVSAGEILAGRREVALPPKTDEVDGSRSRHLGAKV